MICSETIYYKNSFSIFLFKLSLEAKKVVQEKFLNFSVGYILSCAVMNLRVPGHYDLFKRHENSKVFVAMEKEKKKHFSRD